MKKRKYPPNKRNSIYFSASESFDGTYPTNVVVTSEGQCTYIPPGIFKSSCQIDITWFPFDDQNCAMKFGSWTYNGFKVTLFSSVDKLYEHGTPHVMEHYLQRVYTYKNRKNKFFHD